jgi:hypothetical protein
MSTAQLAALRRVLAEVEAERQRQHARFGEQSLPDGTGGEGWREAAQEEREALQRATLLGRDTYANIFSEEVCEAFAESDPAKLRAELVQVAAVAVQWIEAIDGRGVQP